MLARVPGPALAAARPSGRCWSPTSSVLSARAVRRTLLRAGAGARLAATLGGVPAAPRDSVSRISRLAMNDLRPPDVEPTVRNQPIGVPAGAVLDNEEDLRAAYRTYGGELFRFAHRALADEGLAEEAVQETFLRAWRAADRFDPHLASLRTWLFAIARNVVVDLVRRRRARPRSVPLSEAPSKVEDGTEALLRAFQVEEALRRLSPDHRTAIVQIYYKARPAAEVADELGIPAGTLRSRVFYGLRALRLALEEMGWTP